MKRYMTFENFVILLLVLVSLAGHLSSWSYYKKMEQKQTKFVLSESGNNDLCFIDTDGVLSF